MAADANGFPLVRAQLDQLVATHCPPLHLEDAVGVIVVGLAMRLVRFAAPKGPPLDDPVRARCESVALEIVAHSHIEQLHRAGIVPVLAHPHRVQGPVFAWWQRWCAEVLSPLAEAVHATLDPRRRLIKEIAGAIMREALPDDILAGVLAGLQASRREHGRPEHDEDEDLPVSLAATFYDLPAEKQDARYYVGRDSKIHISWHHVRDEQGRPPRRKVFGAASAAGQEVQIGAPKVTQVVKERKFSELVPEEDALDALESLDGLQKASEVTDAAAAVDVEQALDEVVRELRRQEHGAVEVILLDHAGEIVHERITPTDLARERGLSERTFRDTWQRLRTRMASHPRLRGWARIA